MKSNRTILIVEDSRAARALIRSELKTGSYNVLEAGSGAEAVELFKNHSVDLITMDVEMPGMNGYETCQRIRELEFAQASDDGQSSRLVPIIFLTSKDDYLSRIQGFNAGAKEFISKTFTQGELLIAVNKLLESESVLRGLRAVVADESTTARMIAASHLQNHGVEVHEFSDGEQAFEFLKNVGGQVDMLISEFSLQGMDGLQLCERARKDLGLRLPIIVVTADVDRATMLKFYQVGATDYLIKPYLKEELLARLNSHLEIRFMYKNLERQNVELRSVGVLKDRFLSACTHDLRCPVTAILGLTELLQEELNLVDPQAKYLRQIDESGRDLLLLVDELLDFTRVQTQASKHAMGPVNLDELCRHTISGLEVLANKKDIELTYSREGGTESEILGVENGIKRVITNLVSNALKFTSSGGTVELMLLDRSEKLVLLVNDTGIGIPADRLDTIFTQDAKFNRQGTDGEKSNGFGLSIVKEIADLHKAVITVESEEGAGTMFSVEFERLQNDQKVA